MKIIKLTAENVKRLNAVEISPTGDVVIVGGENGAGKSSCLDAIAMALGGEDEVPQKPLKKGAKRGKAVVTLDEDLVITRTFGENGATSLTVSTKEGVKFGSPQSILDKLVGKLTFDPLGFTRLEKKKQLTLLQNLVGLNFDDLDAARQTLYAERTAVNRDADLAEAQLAGMKFNADTPEAEVSAATLVAELNKANAINQSNIKQRDLVQGFRDAVSRTKIAIASRRADLAELQKRLDGCKVHIEGLEATAIEQQDRADIEAKRAGELEDIETDPITDKISQVEGINRRVRENQKRNDAIKARDVKSEESLGLTDKIDGIDAKKKAMLESAKFPVPGLSFDATGVLFNGLPFEQASSAEQLRGSVGMAISLNPKLKIMLCRDGSLLDEKSLKLLAEIVKENGYQCWLERVSTGAECSVIISDGYVAGEKGGAV